MADALARLEALVERLRRECPWDREQTFATISTYILEETHELLETLDGDDGPRLRGELGDVLFQIFFVSRLAQERGWFTIDDVAAAIEAKMIERHPHVFGPEKARDAEAVRASWERRKRLSGEPGTDPLEGIPATLPALSVALRMSERAAGLGFEWERNADLLAKVEEEIAEARAAQKDGDRAGTEEELGDLLFAVANWARRSGIDPERALRGANAKFRRRFRAVSERARREGKDVGVCSSAELDRWWNAVKEEEDRDGGGAPA
ncbi:MAG TPA: nucleoside triphosphate pyrophosphohydrolase [Thermoanaerobaculia bacterium]|nr:nucleoside triphosphate pyrophosphohydrolase [Thermoanaerobaculia bacterium]